MATENKKSVMSALVSRIAAALKIGDEGKLQSFFSRIIRDNEREISRLKQNMETEKITYNHAKEGLDDRLEDAKQALEDAYMSVDISRISTNADQDSYKMVYISTIEDAERLIDRIEEEIEELTKRFEENQKEKQSKIDAYEARNAKLTA